MGERRSGRRGSRKPWQPRRKRHLSDDEEGIIRLVLPTEMQAVTHTGNELVAPGRLVAVAGRGVLDLDR